MNQTMTIKPDARSHYYEAMSGNLDEHRMSRLRHQMELQYANIVFDGMRVLDLGGGNGVHAFYAAASGADDVVVIEPEDAGSTAGVVDQFDAWKEKLGYSNVQLLTTTFQKYEHTGRPFDLIIIQDAINHLDEEACERLLADDQSRHSYENIFSKIASLARSGTILHFSDCSSRNCFPAVGLSNPFDPGIEWDKHQPPDVWIDMLHRVGFELVRKCWSTPTRLGKIGKLVSRSDLFAYFFTSHFIVTMKMKMK
jgi:Methyltransferase domain